MVYTMGKVCKELQHILLNSLIQLTKSTNRHLFLAISRASFCQRANPVTLQTTDPLAGFPGSKALFSGTWVWNCTVMWASSCFWIVITQPESKKRVSLLKSTKADCARNTCWSVIASHFFSFTSFDCSSSQSRVWKVEAISVNTLALQTDFWKAFHSRKCQFIHKETHNPVKQTNPSSPKSVVSGVRAGQGRAPSPRTEPTAPFYLLEIWTEFPSLLRRCWDCRGAHSSAHQCHRVLSSWKQGK